MASFARRGARRLAPWRSSSPRCSLLSPLSSKPTISSRTPSKRWPREVDPPAKGTLLAGADLRRNADDALLDRATSRTVRHTWRALVRLAEARLRVQRARVARTSPSTDGRASPTESPTDAVLSMLDARIAEHVAALARAYAAVDTARAAELGLDDVALRTVESAGEALDHVSRAMIDVQR